MYKLPTTVKARRLAEIVHVSIPIGQTGATKNAGQENDGQENSSPAFSTPCNVLVRHFPVLHFQRPRQTV